MTRAYRPSIIISGKVPLRRVVCFVCPTAERCEEAMVRHEKLRFPQKEAMVKVANEQRAQVCNSNERKSLLPLVL